MTALIRPAGHLLPSCGREKARVANALHIINEMGLLPRNAWEKVPEGRMRASHREFHSLRRETTS